MRPRLGSSKLLIRPLAATCGSARISCSAITLQLGTSCCSISSIQCWQVFWRKIALNVAHHLGATRDAGRIGGHLRIVEPVLAAERDAQALEEGVGQAGDDEVAVAGGEGLVGDEIGAAAAEAAEAGALHQHVDRVVGEQRQHRVEHRHVDALPFAGALAGEEGAEDGVGAVDAGVEVGDRRRRLDRRPALLAGVRHDAAGGLEDQVHARLLRHRAGLAEGGDRAVDEARVDCFRSS